MVPVGKDGWPVERIKGRPLTNLIRILLHTDPIKTWAKRNRKYWDNRITLSVSFRVTEPQALALMAMFDYWTQLGGMGASRFVAFYCDGDGNFQPRCTYKTDSVLPALTDELRRLAVVEDRGGNRKYDFDPVACCLHKEAPTQPGQEAGG